MEGARPCSQKDSTVHKNFTGKNEAKGRVEPSLRADQYYADSTNEQDAEDSIYPTPRDDHHRYKEPVNQEDGGKL